MIFYDYYADVPEETLRDFVTNQELGRFVTVSAEGQPHIGLYPFLFLGDTHRDPPASQRRAARGPARPTRNACSKWTRCTARSPRTGSTPTNAMFATAYHRTVIFECEAEVSEDAEVLAAQQQRLMAHYQPDGGHTPVSTEHAMYRGPFKEISRAHAARARAQSEVEARRRIATASSARNSSPSCAIAAGPPTPARRMHCNGRWITKPRSRPRALVRAPSLVWMLIMLAETAARRGARDVHRARASATCGRGSSACSIGCVHHLRHRLGSRRAGWAPRRAAQQLNVGAFWVAAHAGLRIRARARARA